MDALPLSDSQAAGDTKKQGIGEKELSTHHHMENEIFPKYIRDSLTKLGGLFRGPFRGQNP